jgi:hypothetical protein
VLHQNDVFYVTACGFSKRHDIFHFIGQESGVAPSVVGGPNTLDEATEAAEKIRDTFLTDLHSLGLLLAGFPEGNNPIQLLSKKHSFNDTGTFNVSSELDHGPGAQEEGARSYVLRYRILGVTVTA